MKDETIISLTAIFSILLLTSVALLKGIDGALFMSAVAIIGGIAGYELKTFVDRSSK